jgi:multidrug efflux pump subunit AcrA (membrane-fusion protein)
VLPRRVAGNSFVEIGDLLCTIGPQSFQLLLVEAQSRLAAARTMPVLAQGGLAGIEPLAKLDVVRKQDADSAMAQQAATRSTVRAAIDLARIEPGYTRLNTPIGGVIGVAKAKPGEYVVLEPSPDVLNVLSDIDPFRLWFAIAQRDRCMAIDGGQQALTLYPADLRCQQKQQEPVTPVMAQKLQPSPSTATG